MNRVIGIIGGSGVYDIEGLEKPQWSAIKSPWGAPSDDILTGTLDGVDMAFLPRHGRGHVHSPSSINYRANIDALKRLGVTDIISVSACGSFREHMAPGDFVILDQFIDRTVNREKSFFGTGCVGHVSIAYPTCPRLGDALEEASKSLAKIIATLTANSENARTLIKAVTPILGSTYEPCPHGCDRALQFALMTSPDKRDPALMKKLEAITARVLEETS